jgi:hypothetical protein
MTLGVKDCCFFNRIAEIEMVKSYKEGTANRVLEEDIKK